MTVRPPGQAVVGRAPHLWGLPPPHQDQWFQSTQRKTIDRTSPDEGVLSRQWDQRSSNLPRPPKNKDGLRGTTRGQRRRTRGDDRVEREAGHGILGPTGEHRPGSGEIGIKGRVSLINRNVTVLVPALRQIHPSSGEC